MLVTSSSGKLILGKISKTDATGCQILMLNCTKFAFRWGFASCPDPAGGAYSAAPNPIAVFKGPTSKGRERKGREGRGEGKVKGGNGDKVEGGIWPTQTFWRGAPMCGRSRL